MDEVRPTPIVEDIEGTRLKLQKWLEEKLETDGPVSIASLNIPEGSGMSNVTLLLDAEYQKDGKSHSVGCVGRLQPEIAKPVFPSYDLSVQYRAMETVGQHFEGVPVPELMGLETDTSILGTGFYLMKKIDGRVPSDMPPYNMDGWYMNDVDEATQAAIWNSGVDVMASFHKQAVTKLELFDFIDQPAAGETPLQAQLRYWQNYADWAMEGETHIICQRALDWLNANQPKDEVYGVSWGDSRVGNMMFDPKGTAVRAVIDWEMITFANPAQDIAWWNMLDKFFGECLGFPRLPGLPPYQDTIDRWGAATGISVADYDYYEVFAATRYALILSRISLATGQTADIQENLATGLLTSFMDRIC